MHKYSYGKIVLEDDSSINSDDVGDFDALMDNINAAEASEIVSEVKELSDAIETHVNAIDEIDGAETITIDNVQVKAESDIVSILSSIGGSLRNSKFSKGNSVFSTREESDFIYKKSYVRVEGVKEVIVKIWEHIKNFFAKVWNFLKDLWDRFISLFRSSKSTLIALKKKIEATEDSEFDNVKNDAEVSQQLRILSLYAKHSTGFTTKSVETIEKLSESSTSAFEDLLKLASALETVINSKIPVKTEEFKLGDIMRASRKLLATGIASGMFEVGLVKGNANVNISNGISMNQTEVTQAIKEAPNEVSQAINRSKQSSQRLIEDSNSVVNGGVKTNYTMYGIDCSSVMDKTKEDNFSGVGISSEGMNGFSFSNNSFLAYKSVKVKIKSDSHFTKNSDKKGLLMDICDYGIDFCDEVSSKVISKARKGLDNFKKEADKLFKEVMGDSKDKNDTLKVDLCKISNKIITLTVTNSIKCLSIYATQPKEFIYAVRNGINICESSKS